MRTFLSPNQRSSPSADRIAQRSKAQRSESKRERILLARHMVQAMSVALLHPGDILEVFGTLRARHIVAAREVMAMVLHGRGFSYPEIAQAFGKPRTSHVSALEQHRKAGDKLECDAFLTGMRQTTMTAAVHDAELAASKIEKMERDRAPGIRHQASGPQRSAPTPPQVVAPRSEASGGD